MRSVLTKLIREGQRQTNSRSSACALYTVLARFLRRVPHRLAGGEVHISCFPPVGPETCRRGRHAQSNDDIGMFILGWPG